MRSFHVTWCCIVVSFATITAGVTAADVPASGPAWQNGPPDRPDYFPLAVWLQVPANAPRYKDIGINLYVGLWQGPTEAQLAALKQAGMPVICHQNDVALASANRSIIVGWMHGDEPDNAQPLPGGRGYGPPVVPEKIVEDYARLRQSDPTRPVLLNLGQGVAWDGWIGRGVRSRHPEDYPEYVKGCDIASFDIYPAVSTHKDTAGKLWLVAFGVDRLRQWSDGRKIVWNCIETTRIGNDQRKPTPAEVKTEVWMSIIHGSRGIIYFAHEFKPRFIEAGLLADADMARAVKAINQQVTELAAVINSPAEKEDPVVVSSSRMDATVDTMVRRHAGGVYVFAVNMRDVRTRAKFTVKGAQGAGTVQVIGESRQLGMSDGRWADDFDGYGVHLYRVVGEKDGASEH